MQRSLHSEAAAHGDPAAWTPTHAWYMSMNVNTGGDVADRGLTHGKRVHAASILVDAMYTLI